MSPSTDSPAVLHVCRSCTRRGIATAGPALAAALREALAEAVGSALIRWHLIGRVPPPDHAPPGGLQ